MKCVCMDWRKLLGSVYSPTTSPDVYLSASALEGQGTCCSEVMLGSAYSLLAGSSLHLAGSLSDLTLGWGA